MIKDPSQLQSEVERPILYALAQFKKNNGETEYILKPGNEKQQYKEFLRDPLGKIKREEIELKKNRIEYDEFTK